MDNAYGLPMTTQSSELTSKPELSSNDVTRHGYSAKVDAVEEIRTRNNVCWMNILRIALRTAPDETKEELAKIETYDNQVRSLLKEIAES